MQDETETPLDAAHRAMKADPEGEGPRLRFHERVLDAELFVPLEAEAEGDQLRPLIYDLEEGRFVLAFDRDARLAAFLDAPSPYAALAGRRLVAMLTGRDLGIALNPGVAPSETALGPEVVDWLAAMAAGGSEIGAARLREVGPPRGASEALIAALDAKLAAMAGRIAAAWLVRLRLEDGTERFGLGVAGAPPAAEAGVAEAIAEALRFSGAEEDGLDVIFLSEGGAFARVGLRFEMPAPPEAAQQGQARPPILR